MKKYFEIYKLHKDVIFILLVSLFIFSSTFFIKMLTNIEFWEGDSFFSVPKVLPIITFFHIGMLLLSSISVILNTFILIRNILTQSISFTFYNGYKKILNRSFIIIMLLNITTILYVSLIENFNEFIYYGVFSLGYIASITFLICTIPTCELDILSKKSYNIEHWIYPYLNDKQLKQLRLVKEHYANTYILTLPNVSLSDSNNWFKYHNKVYNLSAFKQYIETKSCKIDDLSNDDFLVIEMLGIK